MATTSFSRLGSANTYDSAMRNVSARKVALSNLQENLTSGKRVVRASDDPTSAGIAERALTRISRIATDQRTLESQRTAITQAESVLGDVTDALQRFRELTVSAGNAGHTTLERQIIAQEMRGLRDQVFALANREDSNGLPLFSALGSALKPFVGPQATPPDYTFNGLPGQSSSSDVAIPFALDGDAAFMLQPARDGSYNVKNSNLTAQLQASGVTVASAAAVTGSSYNLSNIAVTPGTLPGTSKVTYDLVETTAAGVVQPMVTTTEADYPSTATGTSIPINLPGLSLTLTGTLTATDSLDIQPNASLLSVLDNAIRDIGSASTNHTASQAVSQALHNIDIGMQRVSAVRGQAGELLNRADRISNNQDKRSIQMEADRSRAEDLDMVKGISDFQNQQTGFQAALQTYALVQKLSLFNYIS